MKRTSYRHRLSPASRLSCREEPPAYGATASLPDEDPDHEGLAELFRYLRTIDSEPTSTLARQLIDDGIELPRPESFTEESVRPKLWEVIHGLARRRNFLYSTDHLSDLELYRYLWEVTLNEPTHELDDHMGDCACHIDLVSDGSDESIWLWLRYYADQSTRLEWAAEFPGEMIPEHLDPPHDRDRHLPSRFPECGRPGA